MMRRRASMFGLAATAAIAFAAGPLAAETVRIRSGEHDGFTRIVADRGAEHWSLGRTRNGYELRLDAGEDFDLAGAFRLIGRNRVAALSPGEAPGSLRIDIGCDCHATAFATAAGGLAVDIADGPPPPESPFEAPLAPEPVADSQPSPQSNGDDPSGGRRANPEGSDAREVVGGHAKAATADPRLAFFWRGIQVPDGNVDPAMPTMTGSGPEKFAGREADPSADVPSESNDRTQPVHITGPAATEARAPAPSYVAPASPGIDDGAGPAAVAPEPATPSSPHAEGDAELSAPEADVSGRRAARRMEAQATLLHELSRAASQGLVEIDASETRQAPPEAPAAAPPSRPAAETHDAVGRPLAVHAETSIDRDALSVVTRQPTDAEGEACLTDDDFAIGNWGDDRPFAVQIAEKRAGLVGEFDRPSPEGVLGLARLYLYFGFGAEARSVLRSFEVVPDQGAILTNIGHILDGQPPGDTAAFSDMAGCDTAAALWALMAWPQVPPAADVATGAAVRAFAALPPHLRRALGPGVSERLIAIGKVDAARSVRNAISRIPESQGHALDMVAAQVDLASGNAAAGETRLGALAGSNDPLSADALILAVESRLERGEAVEPALADSAEALAFELQDGARGPALTSLHILARASTGEFDRAFAGWDAWPPGSPGDLRAVTAERLFGMLAEKADDRTFLLQYFRQRHLVDWPSSDLMLRLDLADRLAEAGFTGEVKRLLRGEAGYTERGRHLLARAALDEYDPVAAMSQVAGLTGPVAAELRAEATAMSGDHSGAAALFRSIEQEARAGEEAWRAGNLPLAATIGPDPVRAALEILAHGPATPPSASTTPGAPALGALARGRDLVDNSRAARNAISALLAGSAGSPPATGNATGG